MFPNVHIPSTFDDTKQAKATIFRSGSAHEKYGSRHHGRHRYFVSLLLPRDAIAERGYEIACRLSVRLSVCL